MNVLGHNSRGSYWVLLAFCAYFLIGYERRKMQMYVFVHILMFHFVFKTYKLDEIDRHNIAYILLISYT